MGRIYIMSTDDLPESSIVLASKEDLSISELKSKLYFKGLRIVYEAYFSDFKVEPYRGYIGFDDYTNSMLEYTHPAACDGFIESTLSKYKSKLSDYIFDIHVDKLSEMVAYRYWTEHRCEDRVKLTIGKIVAERKAFYKKVNDERNAQSNWARKQILKNDISCKSVTDQMTEKMFIFMANNPYTRPSEPRGIGALFSKLESKSKKWQLERARRHDYLEKIKARALEVFPNVDYTLCDSQCPFLTKCTCGEEIDDWLWDVVFSNDRLYDNFEGRRVQRVCTIAKGMKADCIECGESYSVWISDIECHIFSKENIDIWVDIWESRCVFD